MRVSRQWQPRKKTVELEPSARPSRIRREPAPDQPRGLAKINWGSREWEVRFAVIGVIAFALALCVLAVAFSSYVGWSPRQYSVKLSATE